MEDQRRHSLMGLKTETERRKEALAPNAPRPNVISALMLAGSLGLGILASALTANPLGVILGGMGAGALLGAWLLQTLSGRGLPRYLALPIAFPRPELGSSLAERVLAVEYAADFRPGANKLPSLHVTFAWLASVRRRVAVARSTSGCRCSTPCATPSRRPTPTPR